VGLLLLLPRLDQLLTAWERAGLFNRDVLERLEWFADPFGVSDHSSWSRAQVVKEAWDKFAQAPFFGYGTGFSSELSLGTHNQYLAFMLDHGIIGAAILPVFLLALLRYADGPTRQIGQIFALSVLVLAFGTHNLLDNEYSLFLFSLMGAMAAAHHFEVSSLAGEIHVLSPSASSVTIKA
jgi:O-antigen ligase